MKRMILSLMAVLMVFSPTWGQTDNSISTCNIIQSKYYQRVAEAELDFYLGESAKAYTSLRALDQECGLENSTLYHELYYYALLSIQLQKTETAFDVLQRLVNNYGYKLSDFELITHYSKLKKAKQWEQFSKKCTLWEEQFVSDTAVFLFFHSMEQNDQKLRKEYLDSCNYYQQDSLKLASVKMRYAAQMDSVDYANGMSLLAFLTENQEREIKLSHYHRQSIYFSMMSIVIHCANQPELYDSLLSILREAIPQRRLPPELFAALIDRHQLNEAEKYIYGFYDHLNPEQIIDFQNIDERRWDIGLSSSSVEKELKSKQMEWYINN